MTIASDDVTATFAAAQGLVSDAGRGAGPEDVFADEGYDEAQRAEILETESPGPNDGVIQTDIRPDLGGGDADDDETDATDIAAANEEGSEALLPDDAGEAAERDDEDFDVDDENTGNAPGQLGA